MLLVTTASRTKLTGAPCLLLAACQDLTDMCKDWERVHFCNGSYVYQHKPVHTYWCPKTCKACSSAAAASGQASLASAGASTRFLADQHW